MSFVQMWLSFTYQKEKKRNKLTWTEFHIYEAVICGKQKRCHYQMPLNAFKMSFKPSSMNFQCHFLHLDVTEELSTDTKKHQLLKLIFSRVRKKHEPQLGDKHEGDPARKKCYYCTLTTYFLLG